MDGKPRGQSNAVREYIARMVQAMNNYQPSDSVKEFGANMVRGLNNHQPPDRGGVGEGKTAKAAPESTQQER
jgi:hypothetical protein